MRVHLDHPVLVDELIALAAGDCLVSRLNEATCAVEHPAASDHREAWIELGFFLKAWEAQHGVRVALVE